MTVLYRVYRPQKFSDLVGQVAIASTLLSQLENGKFSHGYLFYGPKGTGKTSTARILAKAVNCQRQASSNLASSKKNKKNYTLEANKLNAQFSEPCNKCDSCVAISEGSYLDVLEIDAASNRGIDEIRDLREKIKLSPINGRFKVYIIDEAHMLTTEAFNALLKTLEEPPAHVVFIFCTTEPHKVPATILSRCFQIMFRKATEEELTRSFHRIAKGEKIQTDKEGLAAIAHLSDGSFRDGAKILEEMVLLSNGKPITKELVEKKYKLTNVEKQVMDLLFFLKEKDSKKAFGLISEITESGVDVKYFLEQLINKLHLILLEKVGVGEKNGAFPILEIYEIKKLAELFSKAYLDTKYAVLEQLPLELAVVEWVSEDENALSRQPHVLGDARQNNTDNQSKLRSLSESLSTSSDNKQNSNKTAFSSPKSGLPPSANATKLDKLFEELIEKVKVHNHSIAGVLRGCSIKSFEGGKLTIETGFKFHKEKLEEAKTMQILEDVMQEITGGKANVSVLLRG